MKKLRPMFDADGEKIKYGEHVEKKKREAKPKADAKKGRSGGMLHSMVGPGELKYITSIKSEPRRNAELESECAFY